MTASIGPAQLAVVIPTFNRARTIERAVASVLADTGGDVELAVVDDCSSDDTLAVLRRNADPRLHVVPSERRGHANRARNLGASVTTAPLIAFLDSDDEFLPGRAARLVRFFGDHPDIDATMDGFSVEHRGTRSSVRPPFVVLNGEAMVRVLVCHGLHLTNSAIAVRRNAFAEVGGFDNDLKRQQDRDLLLRLAQRHRIAIGSGADVLKHQSEDSLSRDPVGYIAGLDALVARHATFREPWARDILGYLVARCIVHEASGIRLGAALRLARALHRATHLPTGVIDALARYGGGRRLRRQVEAELAAMGR